jgi:response regulator RpfG family c-di-GMP phosphodiesterase
VLARLGRHEADALLAAARCMTSARRRCRTRSWRSRGPWTRTSGRSSATLIGERILRVAPSLAQAAELVRWSHERFDGSGYPDGLAGEEIPLAARIIGVCDAYAAMTSSRPYRPTPMSPEGALAELQRSAGTQFDPSVVEAFAVALSAVAEVRAS